MNTYWKEITVPINMADVVTTYNGQTGCACGCGGDYAKADSNAAKARVNKINKRLDESIMLTYTGAGNLLECCIEVPTTYDNAGRTLRCTRVYVNVTDPAALGGVEISHEEWLDLLR